MILIACVDDRDGMLFNGRRQSQDRILRQHILDLCHAAPLWMNAYSAGQFPALPENVRVDEDCLLQAGDNEFCFVENLSPAIAADRIQRVILYRWGRVYPADRHWDIPLLGWTRLPDQCFAGSSHETITKEEYRR